jgi:cysteinyl-tRNA synthetase
VNITDVEDKLIEAAAAANTNVSDMAAKYGREYLDCLAALGIDTIDRFPKASEHIPEIIEMCQKLIDLGSAYAAEGNVYFDVTKDTDYGKLSHRKVEEQESGVRTLEGQGKRNPADFAVWKAAKKGEPTWESPWGPGRPGWHIECSAMSMKYLGQTFDIHGGGMDLLFPHHENELAQSESATGKPFVKYWMHNGLTRLNTKKMSGSIGNVVAAQKLIDDNGPLLLRYMLLTTHYRRPIEFNDEVLSSSKKALSVFLRLFERIELLGVKLIDTTEDMETVSSDLMASEHEHFIRAVVNYKMKFLEMMDDDFNTAGAIGVMHELAGEINSYIEKTKLESDKHADTLKVVAGAAQTLKKLAQLLGLFRTLPQSVSAAPKQNAPALTDQLMQLIIELRAEVRKKKDFATADAIRDGLAKLKITIEDRPTGTIWRKE